MKIDVIIPVGPGHERLYKRAASSVGVASRYYYAVTSKPEIETISVKVMDDTHAMHGRSKARNDGVAESDADWLFFLDADDEMHPEALVNAAPCFETHDGIWGTIVERAGQWLEAARTQVPVINSYDELIHYPPTMTLQMGHFVRREVAKAHPFDERMDAGEDFKYYLEVWKAHRCIKIDKPLSINHRGEHSEGARSANGAEWGRTVHAMLRQARAA